jgi:alkylation response protein AidB-like acyl-CoA dehydrogenase
MRRLTGFVADVPQSAAPGVRERPFMTIRDSAGLSEDQDIQHDTLRAFLTDQLSSAELRNALEGEPGYRPELHAQLAGELGLSGWTIPEEFGGLGKSQVEACAIHIELGRVLYPGPFVPSSVAAGALLATGHREACDRWLPQLAAGTVTGTVAAADEAGYWTPGPGSVRADYGTGGWRLSGRRWYVVAAHAAGILVVPAVTESGLAMFLAETGSPSLEISRQLDLDLTRRISIITFEAAPAVLLTKDAGAALARAEREFLIATAAEAAGGIGWCLDASLAYVREQGQSEHSAGSFEAVASFCIDMLADLEKVSAAARYAAAATDVSAADAQKAARVAALQAGGSYRRAAEATIGMFGDIGFTQGYDAQLYYRRAWSAERLSGGPQAHRDALAAQLPQSGPASLARLSRSRRLNRSPSPGLKAACRVQPRRRDRYAGSDPGARAAHRHQGRIAQW